AHSLTSINLDIHLGNISPLNHAMAGLAIDPTGKYLVVAATDSNLNPSVAVVDLDLNKPVFSSSYSGFFGLGISLNSQGTHAFFTVGPQLDTVPVLGTEFSQVTQFLDTDAFGGTRASYGGQDIYVTAGATRNVYKLPQIIAPTAHLETRTNSIVANVVAATRVKTLTLNMASGSGSAAIAQMGDITLSTPGTTIGGMQNFNVATAGT